METLKDFLDAEFDAFEIEYRVHATRRMFERRIFGEDVDRVLSEGKIIERYEDELPLRHLLVSARVDGRPLHVAVVVNLREKRLTVITVYEPEPHQWTRDFTKRKR